MNTGLLRVAGLSKSFGAICALKAFDITIQQTCIHGIIGPNGSGKTTFFNCITGLTPAEDGAIYLESTEITRLKPALIARLGIRRTFQQSRLVESLTVHENVMAGLNDTIGTVARDMLRRPWKASQREKRIAAAALQALALVGLEAAAGRWAADLVWAERQLVQIARAIVAQPRLLLLDEPAAGMGRQAMMQVAAIIRTIRAGGVTVVVISHDVKLLMDLCDWVTVINFGEKIAEGRPAEIQRHPAVLEAYLGVP